MKQKVMKACLGILWGMFTLTTFLLQSCDNGKEVTPAQGSGGSPFNPHTLFRRSFSSLADITFMAATGAPISVRKSSIWSLCLK